MTRRFPRLTFHVLGVTALCLLCTSCSKADSRRPVYPASGKVLYEGKAIPGAMLFFHPLGDSDPDAPRPRGFVEKDGTFRVSTYLSDDGAPAGAYAITITWYKQNAEGEEEGDNLLPAKYADPSSTDVKREIQAQPQNDLGTILLKR